MQKTYRRSRHRLGPACYPLYNPCTTRAIGAGRSRGSLNRCGSWSRIAQLVEQLTVNQRVVGSSPTSGANSTRGSSTSWVPSLISGTRTNRLTASQSDMIARPYAAGETVDRVVGFIGDAIEIVVVETHRTQHRAEDLFAKHRHIGLDDRDAVGAALVEIADAIEDLLVREQTRTRGAYLTRVVEDRTGRTRNLGAIGGRDAAPGTAERAPRCGHGEIDISRGTRLRADPRLSSSCALFSSGSYQMSTVGLFRSHVLSLLQRRSETSARFSPRSDPT